MGISLLRHTMRYTLLNNGGIMTKECTKCKAVKSFDEFYKDKNKLSGRQSNCKICQDAATKKWRKGKGKEAYKAYKPSPEANVKRYKRNRVRSKVWRHTCNDAYIRELICKKSPDLKPKDIPQQLVDVWKVNLKLKRALRKPTQQEKQPNELY